MHSGVEQIKERGRRVQSSNGDVAAPEDKVPSPATAEASSSKDVAEPAAASAPAAACDGSSPERASSLVPMAGFPKPPASVAVNNARAPTSATLAASCQPTASQPTVELSKPVLAAASSDGIDGIDMDEL